VREELLKAGEGFVLDGFPRTLPQAEALDQLLDEIDRPLSIILLLALDDATARERLTRRAEREGRTDDTPAAIDARLANYHEKTEPVVDHYRASGNLVQVHAVRPIEDLWAEISNVLEQVQARA
jgi:adenylate kinase